MHPRIDRDHSIDLLRGFFICIVIVDHIGWFPSAFEVVSGRGGLFASAAEGFLLISGVLVGQIRGGEVKSGRFGVAAWRCLRRAGVLALWTAIVTLVLHVVAHDMTSVPEMLPPLRDDGPLRTVLLAITLRYCYGHHSFLAFYALYLLAAPAVLWLLARGQTLVVLLASFGLWLGALLVPGTSSWSGGFAEHSWQVLFVLGVVVGFHRDELRAAWRRSGIDGEAIFRIAAALALATFALSWFLFHNQSVVYRQLFKREEIGPGRLAFAILWTSALYAAVKRHEQAVVRAVGRFFLPLGRHSLYVFLVHAVIIFPLFSEPMHSLVVDTLVDACVVGLMWVLVSRRVLFRLIPS